VIGIAGSCLAAAALSLSGLAIGAGSASGSTGKQCASSATKCFSISVTPPTVPPGSTKTFSFTVVNDAPTQTLGSMEITKPAGFTITGAAITGSSESVPFTNTYAKFLNLGVAPSSSLTVTVTATAPCAAETSKWGIQVKQSNDFSGTGNTFAIKSKPTVLNVKVTAGAGGCSVAFIPTNEPKTTVRTAAILNGFDSSGTPVEVGAYTPTGTLASTFNGMITLQLSRKPKTTPALLSGRTSVTVVASGGIAKFPTGTLAKLSINLAGSGYQLEATSPGLTASPKAPLSQYSSLFSIYTKLAPCPKTSHNCTVTGSTTQNKKTRITLTETTTSAPLGGFVGFGFGGAPTFAFGCNTGTYLVRPVDTATTDVFMPTGTPTKQNGAQTTWKIVYEITKSIVKASGQNGASQWQICYASTTPFKTAGGTIPQPYQFPTLPKVTYYIGLLPTCPSTPGMPCILTRHKDNSGDEVITIKASGDSYVRP
jgi:hypothetical protein